MATLAPTISHSLAGRSGGESGMQGEHCSTPSMASMPAMASTDMASTDMASMDAVASMPAMQHEASNPPASKHAQDAAMSDGDACGYCSLLAHMPVVPSVEALFFVTVRALEHSVATRFESVQRVEPLTFAQPRAPPFVS
ncbi:hypothetical protein AYM40_09485 [Paraburkholderia phytofirmans OLGA172]|uniref:DUF2946 domain-containing protein n=1 Tax=Paraburkholderia phytofirmans OLGA172 TaxID=1417228 RepID=A0A161HZ35_9BURK|nr:hypothetical protein AYM40_09485 [Paraburkholderia phytofirmans OLGA172]